MSKSSSEKFEFENLNGELLAGKLELPLGPPITTALFAHCFTCSKDIAAATRISRSLAQLGIAVLRFDFTGLGNSDGDFANTNFSSSVSDLKSACQALAKRFGQGPRLVIGHSLGGAAVLAAANELSSVEAVVTIGAPSEVNHVSHLFGDHLDEIKAQGQAKVTLAGRDFLIKKQFLEDIESAEIREHISKLRKALLIFHSPQDEIVSIDHAKNIYIQAKHPKSFVSLDKADHLLSKPEDSEYVAHVIKAWCQRYLSQLQPNKARPEVKEGEVVVVAREEKHTQDIYTHHHHLIADEPRSLKGQDFGPNPQEILLASLGACTSMTLRMYAEHKGIVLDKLSVKLSHEKIRAEDCEDCETQSGSVDQIIREIYIEADITDEQRQRLLDIAEKCPVHKTLHNEVKVRSKILPSNS